MGKGTTMKLKFPLLLLLGIVFLASATVSFGLAYREKENPISHNKCLQNQGRCKLIKNHESEEWEGREEQHESRRPWRERGSQESEEEQEHDPREQPRRRHQEQEQEQPRQEEREQQQGRGEEEEEEEDPWGQRHQSQREREREPRRRSQREKEQERQQRGRGREQKEEEGEGRGERRREDPKESERMRRREQSQREERGQRHKKREQREEKEGQGSQSQSQSQRQNNPFHFSSNRFQTRYKNRNGQIRVLQRFDQRSSKLQNLQNYRIVEYETRPNTLVLPHHSDAEHILVVLRGRATVTIVMSNDKQAYNLEYGDALRLPAGTTTYILNRDDNLNLRVVDLAMPVNKPGQFDDFFPSSTENQQSYFRGFSRNTLEAAFNTRYEEIKRILLGEEEQEQEQEQEQERHSQEEGVIVKVSKEQIQELSKHAQSSSRKGKHSKHSKSGPFNLRSNKPVYSNKFGKFYEITPDKNSQLEDLELSLSYVEINKGALMLPHYNSEAIVITVVSEGKGNLELVGLREQQQQHEQQEEEEEQQEEQEEQEQEEEGNRQVQSYRARLSPGDTFVIPAGYPVSINASSNLYLLGFGISAENNQRNFLAGEDDNVISQLDRQVKELAFPGSAQDVERLINNQQQSYFANGQPQQSEEGRQGRRGPLSSILGAFY